jgi:putative sigma-54 modulation protein
MDIQITTRHLKVADDLLDEIRDKVDAMQRFYEKISHCHVVFDSEHTDKTCEIVMTIMGATVTGKAKSDSIRLAAEGALEKVERQLKKSKEKMKNHKADKTMR